MRCAPARFPWAYVRRGLFGLLLACLCLIFIDRASVGWAQEALPPEVAPTEAGAGTNPAQAAATGPTAPTAGPAGDKSDLAEAQRRAEAALAAAEPDEPAEEEPAAAQVPEKERKMDILELARQGGPIMYPIYFVSFMVVVFTVERALGLRRRKVLPPRLFRGLAELSKQEGGLNPRHAYKLCQQYPSAASNVIKAVLLKVGRPHGEIEHTVVQVTEREAGRLYNNVRWLGLASGITPLLGLLGTVSGMIQAFFVTSTLEVSANRSQALAEGIYEALVTTFAGLCVAIPAAVIAYFFEGRIQRLFRELDEALMGLLPQLERFEGRLRVRHDDLDQSLRAEVPGRESKSSERLPGSTAK
jgi:biopolymer transport protein ExbB